MSERRSDRAAHRAGALRATREALKGAYLRQRQLWDNYLDSYSIEQADQLRWVYDGEHHRLLGETLL